MGKGKREKGNKEKKEEEEGKGELDSIPIQGRKQEHFEKRKSNSIDKGHQRPLYQVKILELKKYLKQPKSINKVN